MKYLEFKPAVNFEQFGKLPFKEALSTEHLEKNPVNLEVSLDSIKENNNREKPPLGIETAIVYIAIPAGMAIWIGIIYLVNILFF